MDFFSGLKFFIFFVDKLILITIFFCFCLSDIDFDSYWDEEARNPNRNRIRIGRQYQAQCPLLLKSGLLFNIQISWLFCHY